MLNNYNSNWKKVLGFRNMQEKLEKYLGMSVDILEQNWLTLKYESLPKQECKPNKPFILAASLKQFSD